MVAGGPVGRTRFGLGVVALTAASSPLALSDSESSESCVRVGPPATGSGPTRPAGLAVACRRPSYLSHIRVERAVTRGTTDRGARCPAAAGVVPG